MKKYWNVLQPKQKHLLALVSGELSGYNSEEQDIDPSDICAEMSRRRIPSPGGGQSQDGNE